MRLVLATRNAHKLREFRVLMEPHELVPLPDDVTLPPETGDTFEENARAKAVAAAEATGMPAIADDSGIEAAALGGRPGVRSARYAGEGATDEENLAKLLAEVPADGDRTRRLRLRARVRGARRRRAAPLHRALRGRAGRGAARRRRLRIRPRVRAGRHAATVARWPS